MDDQKTNPYEIPQKNPYCIMIQIHIFNQIVQAYDTSMKSYYYSKTKWIPKHEKILHKKDITTWN